MLSVDSIVFLALTVGGPVALIAAAVAWRTSSRPGRGPGDHVVRVVAAMLLVMGAVVIALATLYPVPGRTGTWLGADINLTLFDTLERYSASTRLPFHIVRDNLLGNVVLFVPLGAGLALAARRWGALVAVVVALVGGALTSLAVEALQWVLPLARSVDVDDVLLNTLGALAGGVAGAIGLAITGLKGRPARPPEGYRRTI